MNMMRERAEAVGATLSVVSQPGRGTQVAIPLDAGPSKGGPHEHPPVPSHPRHAG